MRKLKGIRSVLDIICKYCEKLVDSSEAVCPHCGEPIDPYLRK